MDVQNTVTQDRHLQGTEDGAQMPVQLDATVRAEIELARLRDQGPVAVTMERFRLLRAALEEKDPQLRDALCEIMCPVSPEKGLEVLRDRFYFDGGGCLSLYGESRQARAEQLIDRLLQHVLLTSPAATVEERAFAVEAGSIWAQRTDLRQIPRFMLDAENHSSIARPDLQRFAASIIGSCLVHRLRIERPEYARYTLRTAIADLWGSWLEGDPDRAALLVDAVTWLKADRSELLLGYLAFDPALPEPIRSAAKDRLPEFAERGSRLAAILTGREITGTGDGGALFRAVLENPDDDAPRLVYADWLDDHGGAWKANEIRSGCAMRKRWQVASDPTDVPLQDTPELETLLRTAGVIALLAEEVILLRGEPESVCFQAQELASIWKHLGKIAPVRELLVGINGRAGIEAITRTKGELTSVRALVLTSSTPLNATQWHTFFASLAGRLPNLEFLGLIGHQEMCAGLVSAGLPKSVHTLYSDNNHPILQPYFGDQLVASADHIQHPGMPFSWNPKRFPRVKFW